MPGGAGRLLLRIPAPRSRTCRARPRVIPRGTCARDQTPCRTAERRAAIEQLTRGRREAPPLTRGAGAPGFVRLRDDVDPPLPSDPRSIVEDRGRGAVL